jgi:2-polyprenyl-3-methyl-5-hydroxy-6-metoxy-1,4-benzoquinol methylase
VAGNHFDKHGSRNPVIRWLMRRFHDALGHEIEVLQPESILDVGCGEGRTTRFLASRFSVPIHGAELEVQLLVGAKALVPEGSFVGASVYSLPYGTGAFDLVTATEVLEHLDDPERALEEMLRVARRAVIVTVPHEPWWRLANMARGRYVLHCGNTPGHVQHWTRAGFTRLLDSPTREFQLRGVGLWTFATIQRD